jgi:DNA repair protein RecN (Recombination protein N)
MLKQLSITNIILIESIEISFGTGLNVLSGETGSGKSAIMNALNLIIGGRADTALIRRGCQKGSVEGIFDIDNLPFIQHFLGEAGINHDKGDDLIIRREINLNGKSRHFINNQATQGSCIRQIGSYLASIIGQHANQWLLLTDKHRETVDIYGELQETLQIFGSSFAEENRLSKILNDLLTNESKRFREIEMYQKELEELQSACIKDGEDDEIFAEYSLLTQAETRSTKVNDIIEALSGERSSVISLLNRQKSNLEDLTEMDKSFAETSKSYKNALLEIQEICYSLRSYQSTIEYNPQRAHKLNERLTLITKLKKKYGNTVSEIREYQNQTFKTLETLENQDVYIEDLKNELSLIEIKNNELSAKISEKRKVAAIKFERAMTDELRSLNMPKVVFEVELTSQKRNAKGDDHLEFYLIPNVGEHRIPIKASASGGELSRILLAIQTLLAGKEKIPTLIFDEIDSNIGGETASIIGEKLKEIGENTQVLCITHFPQVAKHATHHYQISKKEENGRTFTNVVCLNNDTKANELTRMIGGV